MESKTCYIINFYLGERRKIVVEYERDRLYLLKKQIEYLQAKKHNLNRIIFTFNIRPEDYHFVPQIFSLTPKQIQGATVEINFRENWGMSYAAYSELFGKYKSEFDYYIFNEDDAFFNVDNWDTYLVNKYNSFGDCGYLCMMAREPAEWNWYKKNAGASNGIASTENLMKIWNKYGKLAHVDNSDYTDNQDIQHDFAWQFFEFGLNIYDVRDDYQMIVAMPGPDWLDPIDVWWFFQWNEELLVVPARVISEEPYAWFECIDPEFLQEHTSFSVEEAMKCYNEKLDYKVIRNYEDGTR